MLFVSLHIYSGPQHVYPRPPWWMLSQTILAPLRGNLCRILQMKTSENSPSTHSGE
jgi:hypothetical protein